MAEPRGKGRWWSGIFALLLVGACSDNNAPDTSDDTGSIGPNGWEVALAGGEVRVVVPASALSTAKEITISLVDPPAAEAGFVRKGSSAIGSSTKAAALRPRTIPDAGTR